MRALVHRVDPKVAGRSRVHDAFSSERVPTWGLVELLVEALAERTPGADQAREVQRMHQLWLAASGHTALEQPAPPMLPKGDEPPLPPPTPVPAGTRPLLPVAPWDPRPILVMRVEWEAPARLDVDTRRNLRDVVSRALDDIGWPIKGEHRRDGSAGSVITLRPEHEHPSVTAATFLATLDDEQRRARRLKLSYAAVLRFMAYLDRGALVPTQAADILNRLWMQSEIEFLWRLQKAPGGWRPQGDEGPWRRQETDPRQLVAAVLFGLPAPGYFVGDWAAASDYAPIDYSPLDLSDSVQDDAWVRVSMEDPWDNPF
ncbi:hypothetical protein [Streptomyces sp. NPDC058964]|uniref:hypothetical protein n=1 Tax=Streptomyces sp. NPDC058964 TaxID=3346681 RepID=UPI0036B2B476